MAGIFDSVKKLEALYTQYKPVNYNKPHSKYLNRSSLAEDLDPLKNNKDGRYERFYNLIENIGNNVEDITDSHDNNNNSTDIYQDLWFIRESENESNDSNNNEDNKDQKEEGEERKIQLDITRPIKVVDKSRENINGLTSSLEGVTLEELMETHPELSQHFKINSSERKKKNNRNTMHDPEYAKSQGYKMHAFDISPVNGKNYNYLYQFITSNPIMTQWMIDNNLNILDEENNPGRWYWSGSHFHIGPDPNVADGRSGNLNQTRSTTWKTLKKRLGQS